jgi:hypothetical protein
LLLLLLLAQELSINILENLNQRPQANDNEQERRRM